ncbi:ROK family transcriptional regulator [Paenarthrobacter sp. PH39-S1]|uniref:ROK family transcriptional regulator n=1 Tax=Paenarthrobacter sp. PH39-S1 TaxID=3046204 RepID=UPI0024B9D838|nr:ROK family transcriptional regulator [Paenarthrobacter sp. PH39-S1]MDJ0354862.1 ROK family transcriptional regulator [Paenarthrobacter sp. PH39-S1]
MPPLTGAWPAVPAGSGTSFSRAGDLFQLLRDGHARTRAELAEITGLARSTVASRIDALAASGLIGPAGEAVSSGGRPPSRLAFQPTARVVLAADIGATHMLVALTDLGGRVLCESRASIEISAGPQTVLDLVVADCGKLLAQAGRQGRELAGIGIGLPGPVEHSTGRPANPPIMPGWDGFDVPGYVQRSFATEVLVDNDVNIMALGERAMYWPHAQDLLFVKVATGIGAGLISGGLLQRGSDGTAGDIGHVRVPRGNDVLCRCGNYGCLEALASGPAVAAALTAGGIPAATGEDVLELAHRGSLPAIAAMRQAGRDVGDVLASCVNLLNPSIIVIGGGLLTAGDYLMAGVREIVYQRSLPLATARLRIVQSMAADQAGVLGASRMVIDHVLAPASVEALLLRQA